MVHLKVFFVKKASSLLKKSQWRAKVIFIWCTVTGPHDYQHNNNCIERNSMLVIMESCCRSTRKNHWLFETYFLLSNWYLELKSNNFIFNSITKNILAQIIINLRIPHSSRLNCLYIWSEKTTIIRWSGSLACCLHWFRRSLTLRQNSLNTHYTIRVSAFNVSEGFMLFYFIRLILFVRLYCMSRFNEQCSHKWLITRNDRST